MRNFEDKPAVRERVPLLVGIYGPSGTGKTYSALRLARGMQRVVGGEVHVIDTEARRALHYADRFDGFSYRHIDFQAPFSSDDYAAALQHCVKRGASVVIVDNMSHEHEGAGGMLECHEKELDRIAGNDWNKRERCKMLAWQAPKAARRKLINNILQLGVNAIFCFRAKEKIKIVRGKEPEPLGWMPIAGEEFIYEMTATALLMPGAQGVPTWNPSYDGERAMIKRPAQFDTMLRQFDGKPLCEYIGEAMARWADGTEQSPRQNHRENIGSAKTMNDLASAWKSVAEAKANGTISASEYRDLAALKDQRKAALTGGGGAQRPASDRPPRNIEDVANDCGVSPDLVAAIASLADGGDGEASIAAALRSQGHNVDPPTVALVLSAIKK